MSPHTIHW